MKYAKTMAMMFAIVVALFVVPTFVAATVTVSESFSANNPTFGSDSQEASNPEADDEDDEVINDTSSITLMNANSSTSIDVTGITFVPNGAYNLNSQDIFAVSQLPLVVPASSSIQLQLSGKIPEDLDAVSSQLEEEAFAVGSLTIQTSDGSNPTFTVFMQRENKLRIEDFDGKVNGRSRESNLDSGDDIQDLSPGDRVELDIEFESRYRESDNVDIEDVEAELDCDDEQDIDIDDDTLDIGDMGPDDTERDSFNIDVEEDAENGDVSCEVDVDGVDENGARHGETFDVELDITRKTHDLPFRDLSVQPSALTCEDTSFQVIMEVVNLGRSDESRVAIEVTSRTLDINERLTGIDLDEDDSTTETINVPVSPRELRPGTYAIQAQSFYDNTRLANTEIVQIENQCDELAEEEQEQQQQQVFSEALSVEESTITAEPGKRASVKVELANTGASLMEFRVSLENIDEFAGSSSEKTIRLNAGQTSTVFLNMNVDDEAEEGSYTASVLLRDGSSGQVIQTETFTVDVETAEEEDDGESFFNFDFGGEGSSSNALLIIVNVVLVLIAILFVKLIFTSGGSSKKKSTSTGRSSDRKKLADFEPVQKRKRTVKRRKK